MIPLAQFFIRFHLFHMIPSRGYIVHAVCVCVCEYSQFMFSDAVPPIKVASLHTVGPLLLSTRVDEQNPSDSKSINS